MIDKKMMNCSPPLPKLHQVYKATSSLEKKSYLAPNYEGKKHYDTLIEAGRPLAQEDSAQISRIDQVKLLERAWQSEYYRRAINLQDSIAAGEQSISALPDFIKSSKGPVYMNDMRKKYYRTLSLKNAS